MTRFFRHIAHCLHRREILRTLAIFAVTAVVFAPASRAQDLSSIPAAFVDVGIGARSAAMGYTGVASERGASAMAWNPASLASDLGTEIAFSYVDQAEMVEFAHVSWVMPLREGRSAWGLSAFVSGDDMLREATMEVAYSHRLRFIWLGTKVGYRLAEFGKNALSGGDYVVFDPDEVATGLDRQVNGKAQGLLVDLGMRLELTHRLDLGVVARNVAAPVEWTSRSLARPGEQSYIESIPFELSTGAAYQLSEQLGGYLEWTPSLGGDAIARYGMGLSYDPMDVITLRMGRLLTMDRRRDEWKTLGFGIRTPGNLTWSMEADYAFIISDFARTQQISLRFGL